MNRLPDPKSTPFPTHTHTHIPFLWMFQCLYTHTHTHTHISERPHPFLIFLYFKINDFPVASQKRIDAVLYITTTMWWWRHRSRSSPLGLRDFSQFFLVFYLKFIIIIYSPPLRSKKYWFKELGAIKDEYAPIFSGRPKLSDPSPEGPILFFFCFGCVIAIRKITKSKKNTKK
jgi:hypothetical protein